MIGCGRPGRGPASARSSHKYGEDVFTQTCEDLMDYAERADARRDQRLPRRQVRRSTTSIENDGIEAKPYTVAVDVHVQGDEIVADYSRSSPQAQGSRQRHPRRHHRRHLQRHAARDRSASIPKNSGCFRPDPRGLAAGQGRPTSTIQARWSPATPRPTRGSPTSSSAAMSACAPERAMASESCTGTNFVFGGNHPDYDEYFACYDIMSGGWGGRFGEDGNDCVIAINGNCRFNPTEVFETRFPLRVEELRHGHRFRRCRPVARRPRLSPALLLTRCRSPAASAATATRSSPGPCSAAARRQWRHAGPERPAGGLVHGRELYGKVSSSKYANVIFQPGDRIKLITPAAAAMATRAARSGSGERGSGGRLHQSRGSRTSYGVAG